MKIGMMIAIERELKAFLESGAQITEKKIGRKTVYHTQIAGHDIAAVLSGYGEIDAAAATQLLISCEGCETILNFGVAGALDARLRVEDLLAVDRVCHYDYDVSALGGVKKHQYEEYADEFIPVDAGLLRLAKELEPGLRTVAAASGDRFVENREDKLELAFLGCGICEMEAAAIARVCERNGVPCLLVKCISDTFDGDGSDFEKNVVAAAEKAFSLVRRVLERL